MILYEYPFNERIRTYLRLEQLFQRLGHLLSGEQALQHHYALTTIFEIMDVGARADLKSDVLKDLEKQKHVLNGYRGNPSIAESVLDEIIAQMDHCISSLVSLPGKAGQALTENEWLMSIRSRAGIPGGTCSFDLPDYYAWQHKDGHERQQRDSGTPQKVMTDNGQFQQTLPQGRTYQLLRLRIDPALGLIPEISGNRLMVSVRLMRHEADGRLHASKDAAAFELTLCS